VGQQGFGGPAALKYLRSLPMVDRANIGMEGHSLGGARTTSTPSNPSFTLYFNGIPKGMNVLYGDGSVKWASYDAGMSELQWIYKSGEYKAPTANDVKVP
jgi:prepilin-type processing-associated H-X9-DG protein